MLFALALLAAGIDQPPEPSTDPPIGHPHYVADQFPAKAMTLDPTKICKDGFVDSNKLTVQLIVQFDLGDHLADTPFGDMKQRFDGTTCRRNEGVASAYAKQDGYCTGAIIVQRLLLNVYPAFRPYAVELRKHIRDRDLKVDVTGLGVDAPSGPLPEKEQQELKDHIVEYARVFLASPPTDHLIRCDDAPPLSEKDAEQAASDRTAQKKLAIMNDAQTPAFAGDPKPKTVVKTEPPPSTDYLERWSVGDDLAHGAGLVAGLFNQLQWRQTPANLVYRSASGDNPDPYFVTGQDLYNSDSGFTFSLAQTTTNQATVKGVIKPSSKTYAVNFQGAVGYPVFKKDRPLNDGALLDGRTAYYVNFIPYAAIDRESKKDTSSGAAVTDPAKVTANRSELGAVAFLYTDALPDTCVVADILPVIIHHLQTCASFTVLRMDEVRDSLAHSRLDAASLRYVPVIKTANRGLSAIDLCINSVCGDSNRLLRWGVLIDARADVGSFASPGDNVDFLPFNKDYTRLGGRIGLLGDVAFLPDSPIHLWVAYTDVHPLRGYNQDLTETQAQASFNFSTATLSLNWHNGRREDTAQRDNGWKVSIGFKPKS